MSNNLQNIRARRYWFAPHDATTYALGFGDQEVAIFLPNAIPYLAQEIVEFLNCRLLENETKVAP